MKIIHNKNKMSQKHIVRIAPSPTGKLHIGTIRTAYHNYLASQQNMDSKLIVRIDDTDLKRSKPELIQPIFDSLSDLGIKWDITFKQSERFKIYRRYAELMIKHGYAIKKDGCIMLNKTACLFFSCDWVDDITGLKESNPQIDEFAMRQVIIKSDGSPAYNFASMLDDYLTGVTWIIRGVDHIANTYKQVLIFRLLRRVMRDYDAKIPKFSHVGLVCHTTGKKLSKRDSDELELGDISNEALLNYVLRLGWSPKEDTKKNNIINNDRAIELFIDGGNMKSSNAKIDMNKLNWYNKKYRTR